MQQLIRPFVRICYVVRNSFNEEHDNHIGDEGQGSHRSEIDRRVVKVDASPAIVDLLLSTVEIQPREDLPRRLAACESST
jgi:hypothetical protein